MKCVCVCVHGTGRRAAMLKILVYASFKQYTIQLSLFSAGKIPILKFKPITPKLLTVCGKQNMGIDLAHNFSSRIFDKIKTYS